VIHNKSAHIFLELQNLPAKTLYPSLLFIICVVGRQYIHSDGMLSAICLLVFNCSKIDLRHHYTHNKCRGNTTDYGHVIAQAGSHRYPTKERRGRAHVWSCAVCGGQSGTGAGFLRELGFPQLILIPPTTACSSIIWGWYNRPINGRHTKWTQSHPTPRN
jgi:hypothetical protein